jgi:peptidoglycan/LPS O-acetylase OafA/YrhL
MTPLVPTTPEVVVGAAAPTATGGPVADVTPFGYQPALDGLRAVAITLVLCFHGGWSWMTGGYVGVSVFFTLSGFLITNLLLIERDRTGTISLSGFFSRRVRRLLPASLVCLAAVSLLSARGWFVATDRLRGDIVAAALQVANWRALTGDLGYADLVAEVGGVIGPVDHFWSLSIEEQFYWVWPVVAVLLFGRVRAQRSRAVLLVAAAVAAGVAAPLIAGAFGADAAYWATPARLGEILVGAALAGLLRWRTVPRWSGGVGLLGMAIVCWAAVTWPAGSGPAYTGWLPVFALATAAAILGVQSPGGMQRALSVAPLVLLGKVSYGVYLYHWPLFALITPARTGLDGVALFALRLGATLGVAALSYLALEQPIRRARWSPRPTFGGAAAATAAVVVLAVTAVPVPQARFETSLDTSGVGFDDPVSTEAAPSGETAPLTSTPGDGVSSGPDVVPVTTVVPATGPVRMLLIGDSTATALGAGLLEWVRADPGRARLESVASIGCGVMRGSRSIADIDGRFGAECDQALGDRLDAVLATGQVDVAVVIVTLLDAGARVWDESEGPVQPTDPRFVERRRADYDALLDRLAAAGVSRVAWLVPAPPAPWWVGYDAANTNRVAVEPLADLVRTLADERGDLVTAVPFDVWVRQREVGGDRTWRPDGLHLDPAAASDVMERYLGEQLLAVAAG